MRSTEEQRGRQHERRNKRQAEVGGRQILKRERTQPEWGRKKPKSPRKNQGAQAGARQGSEATDASKGREGA